MSRVLDPFDHIRAYAPPPDIEPPSEHLLARVFAESESWPTPPARRVRLMIAGAAALLTVAGVSTAAATGVGPVQIWNDMFGPGSPGTSDYRADPATARKVFSVPGPNGQEFAAWTISNHVGWRCVATFFEPAGTTTAPTGLVHDGSGHSCVLGRPAAPGLFADGDGQYGPGIENRLQFVWQAGDAVRAELQLSTGATLPVAVHNGWLGGWYTRDQVPLGVTATVVAYGSGGRKLGTFVEIDQFGCADPNGC